MEEREENWLKPAKVLSLLGYSAIAVGVVYGVLGSVLLLVSKYIGYHFDTLIQEYKLASWRVVLYMLVTGGIFLADSKILEKVKEKQTAGWKYAVVIFLIFLSVVLLAAGYYIFDIRREYGGIRVVLWQFVFCYVQFVVKCDMRIRNIKRIGRHVMPIYDAYLIVYEMLDDYYYNENPNDSFRMLLSDMDPYLFVNAKSADPATYGDWCHAAKRYEKNGKIKKEDIVLALRDFLNFYQQEFEFDLEEVVAYTYSKEFNIEKYDRRDRQ